MNINKEDQDAQIRKAIQENKPNGSFQFCESWEKDKNDVLVVFVAAENIFREVIYDKAPSNRQIVIQRGNQKLETASLEDSQTSITFIMDSTKHIVNISPMSPVLSIDKGPSVFGAFSSKNCVLINVNGQDLQLELSANNESFLVYGKLRPDVGFGWDLFTFLKLFNPKEREELETCLGSREDLQDWGSSQFEEMKTLFPKKKSDLKIWKEEF